MTSPVPPITDYAVLAALREGPIFDRGWLKPDGRREVEETLARWEEAGLRAKLLLLDRGMYPADWRFVWDELGLDERVDLLLIYTVDRWEARGWGLDDSQIAAALDAAEPDLQAYVGKGLVTALDGLGAAAVGAPVSEPVGWVAPAVGAVSIGVVAASGALGFVVYRRMKLAREGQTRLLDDTRASAEIAYANLILDADRLEGSFDLQERAARLRRELDLVARDTGATEVRLGRMRQVEDEIAALQSTVLQREKNR